MPRVLVLDDNDLARLALRGMLNEQGIRYSFATTCSEAWTSLHQFPEVSLVIVEVKLKSESAVSLLQRMRANAIFRHIPVLVYSSSRDVAVVRSVLAYKPQNYLLKPYRSELIELEIEKAHGSAEAPAVDESAHTIELRARVAQGLNELLPLISTVKDAGTGLRLLPKITAIAEVGADLPVGPVQQFLAELADETASEHWIFLKEATPTIEYVIRKLTGKNAATVADSDAEEKALPPRDFALWTAAESKGQFPLDYKLTAAAVDGLPGFPVIDSMAAAFSMTAEGSQSNLAYMNDLVANDASLSVSVLIAANHLAREGYLNSIENPSLGVSMLGDVKLVALAKNAPRVAERAVTSVHFNWGQYHRFQIAVGRMAEFIRRAVEFKELEQIAYTAGLIHDVGQLALMHIYPHGFGKMVEYAGSNRLSLSSTEDHFLGTHSSAAVLPYFVKQGLPSVYCSVIEHWRIPSMAPAQHADVVAIVSLARFFCEQAGIGKNACFAPAEHGASFESSAGWSVLKDRVFPSFNSRQFQLQAASFGRQLKEKMSAEDYQVRSTPLINAHAESRQMAPVSL